MTKQIDVVSVTLSFPYFGAFPGAGGIAELSVRRTDRFISLRYDGGYSTPTSSKRLGVQVGWRGLIAPVSSLDFVALASDGKLDGEYPWPANMSVTGARTVFSDLLMLAWAGPPVSHIAEALAETTDDQIQALSDSVGGLTSRRFIREMLRVEEEISHGISLGQIFARVPAHHMSMEAVRKVSSTANALGKAQEHTRAAQMAWEVAGFEEDIERLLAAWSARHPPTSVNTAIGHAAMRTSLRDFLRAYVGQHRALPAGRHSLKTVYAGLGFEVDFDQLL